VTHRDEVEAPITDWIREAYDVSDKLSVRVKGQRTKKPYRKARPKRKRR
jgi:hypothetical protein